MEYLMINHLIAEKNFAEALGVSKQTLLKLRQKGCPWISIGGKVYYFEPDFMKWLLENQKRVSDLKQNITTDNTV